MREYLVGEWMLISFSQNHYRFWLKVSTVTQSKIRQGLIATEAVFRHYGQPKTSWFPIEAVFIVTRMNTQSDTLWRLTAEVSKQ